MLTFLVAGLVAAFDVSLVVDGVFVVAVGGALMSVVKFGRSVVRGFRENRDAHEQVMVELGNVAKVVRETGAQVKALNKKVDDEIAARSSDTSILLGMVAGLDSKVSAKPRVRKKSDIVEGELV